MRAIGYHISASRGLVRAMEEATSFGASAMQCFTRNPRGSQAKALDLDDIRRFEAVRKGFGPLFLHGAYTMNLASKDEGVRARSEALLADDLARLQAYPADTIYVFHPGAHTADGIETGILRIVRALDRLREDFGAGTICLETMSGKGSEVGGRLEEIAAILSAVGDPHLHVVLDSCHLYSAGYDLARPEAVAAAIEETVGLSRVRGIHLNDSLTPLASKKDRHAPIGAGHIGTEVLARFVGYEAFSHLPIVLETPGEGADHAKEIRALRRALGEG